MPACTHVKRRSDLVSSICGAVRYRCSCLQVGDALAPVVEEVADGLFPADGGSPAGVGAEGFGAADDDVGVVGAGAAGRDDDLGSKACECEQGVEEFADGTGRFGADVVSGPGLLPASAYCAPTRSPATLVAA